MSAIGRTQHREIVGRLLAGPPIDMRWVTMHFWRVDQRLTIT